jgi:hypothetical protein
MARKSRSVGASGGCLESCDDSGVDTCSLCGFAAAPMPKSFKKAARKPG